MVYKKQVLLVLAFSLALFVLPSLAGACHLAQGTYYTGCSSGTCYVSSQCGTGATDVYEWAVDLGGCDTGCAAGQFYWIAYCDIPLFSTRGQCVCGSKEAKWKKSCSNGDICKIKAGASCGAEYGGGSTDRWDATTNWCVACSGKIEVGIRYCSGGDVYLGDGNGKCEQACGADAACDEKNPNEECGTNGRCTSYCLCCEASDSDNGKDYLKKGTATGTVLEGGSYSCQSKTDSCVGSTIVREYYTGSGYLFYEDHDCSNDENKKCVDGHCGCEYDSDCPASPVNNTKGKCNPNTHTCYWPPCKFNSDCVDTYCCDADPSVWPKGTGNCVNKIYSANTTYLCFPQQ